MALVSWALTTLAAVKEVLGIVGAGSDTALENLINRATGFIEGETDRKLASRNYLPYVDFEDAVYSGKGTRTLRLRQYPVTNLERVDIDDICVQFSALADSGAADMSTLVDASLNVFADNFFDGAYIDVIGGTSAGDKDKSVSSFVSATGACTMSSGHYFTTQITATSRYVLYTGLRVWVNRPPGILTYRDVFTYDYDNVEVWYTAGYLATDPEFLDLEQLCIALVRGAYYGATGGTGGGLRSERIGNYSYTRGPGGDLEESWMQDTIKRYKRKDYF